MFVLCLLFGCLFVGCFDRCWLYFRLRFVVFVYCLLLFGVFDFDFAVVCEFDCCLWVFFWVVYDYGLLWLITGFDEVTLLWFVF